MCAVGDVEMAWPDVGAVFLNGTHVPTRSRTQQNSTLTLSDKYRSTRPKNPIYTKSSMPCVNVAQKATYLEILLSIINFPTTHRNRSDTLAQLIFPKVLVLGFNKRTEFAYLAKSPSM